MPATSAVARTLPAMTAVQAVVAMGTFSISVLAPQLGVDVQDIGLLGSLLFGIGALSSLAAGGLIKRLGDLPLTALCMTAVMLAMLCLAAQVMGAGLSIGHAGWPLWLAVFLLGLAFGPETPASASVLARVTPLAQRPWIFSVRQTGNQIGAMTSSLILPFLLIQHVTWPFAFVAMLAMSVALWCWWLQQNQYISTTELASPPAHADLSGLRELMGSPLLRLLTLTTLIYMATQVCLNLFLMTHAVRHWQLPVATAAGLVAIMQGAGLVGRLMWGKVAQRPGLSTVRLLGSLGVLMGLTGLLLFLWPATPSLIAMTVLLTLLGLSASGWNGVMMAEIARIVGPARAGAVTGAVLLFGHTGLALSPIGFAVYANTSGTLLAFAVLLGLASLMGAWIALSPRQRCPND